jgi:hypothetical protein
MWKYLFIAASSLLWNSPVSQKTFHYCQRDIPSITPHRFFHRSEREVRENGSHANKTGYQRHSIP